MDFNFEGSSLMHWFYAAWNWFYWANCCSLWVDTTYEIARGRLHGQPIKGLFFIGAAFWLVAPLWLVLRAAPDRNLRRAKRAATELIGPHLYNFSLFGALVASAGWSAHEQAQASDYRGGLFGLFGRPAPPRLHVAEFQRKWLMGAAYSLVLASKLRLWERPPRCQRHVRA